MNSNKKQEVLNSQNIRHIDSELRLFTQPTKRILSKNYFLTLVLLRIVGIALAIILGVISGLGLLFHNEDVAKGFGYATFAVVLFIGIN